ncbi:MAG: helix-turn-helix transcriptional regulator [Caldiserica bacterium]|nr:helix-turn-helix transcriptional regulator [Caldisericota bacterium]
MKDFRLKKGLTLRELAREIGISPAYLNQIENGVKVPSFKTLKKLAEYYGLNMQSLVVSDKKGKYQIQNPLGEELTRYVRRLPEPYLEKVLEFAKFQYLEWRRESRQK